MTNPLAQDLGGVEAFCDAMEREHGYRPKLLPNGILLHGRDADRYEGWELAVHSAEIAGALRDAERWHPIESAPMDGRAVILAHMGGKPYIGKWCHDTWVDERGLSRGPSHWRPLPAPPTLDSAMQQGGGGVDNA